MEKSDNRLRALSGRLTRLRTELVCDRPFFGRLLLHLSFGCATCGTAYTDMEKIVFDPDFAETLTDDELRFVLLHELMHCVLRHPARGRGLMHERYNIACDIVVNSLILETMGLSEFPICGEPVMHIAPNGLEGRLYSAEEVYDMLRSLSTDQLQSLYGCLDSHEIWTQIDATDAEGKWSRRVLAAAKGYGTGLSKMIERCIEALAYESRMDWRQLLQDFIRHDRSDFVFETPDRRYQGDIILPSFQDNLQGDTVDKLWFLIDTSASVDNDSLATAFYELKDAVSQLDGLEGELSFFDEKVTPPVPFSTEEELLAIRPWGGGGTSFGCIFRYLPEHYGDDLPRAIVILTDGYSDCPREDAALGVPVLWIVIDSEIVPPWGEWVQI